MCVSTITETPQNDECINAESINIQSDYANITYTNGTLTNATLPLKQLAQICTNYKSYNYNNYVDVWYRFTATSTTHVLAYKDLYVPMNAAYFTYDIYEGGCDNLKCITPKYNLYNSDDIGYGSDRKILNNLIPGKEYYIRLGNTKAAFEQLYNYNIAILTAPQNLGDDINSPITIVPSSSTNCDSELTFLYSGLANPSTSLNVTGCSSNFNLYLDNGFPNTKYYDTWLEFTANNSELILNAPFLVQLFSGNPAQLQCEENNISNSGYYLLKNLIVGKKYYLRIIEQENNRFSEYKICLKKAYSIPINDEYENAIEIVPSNDINNCNSSTYLVNRATYSSNVAKPTCFIESGFSDFNRDVWYKFTASSASTQLNVILGVDLWNPNIPLNVGRPVLYRKNSQNIFEQVYCYDWLQNNNNYFRQYNAADKLYIDTYNFTDLNVGEIYYVRMMFSDYVNQLNQELKLGLCLKNFNNTPPENDNISSATELMVSPTDNCAYIQGNAFLSTSNPAAPQWNSTVDLCYDDYNSKDVWYKFNTNNTSVKLNFNNLSTIPYPFGNGEFSQPYITIFEENGQNNLIRINCFYPSGYDYNNLIINNLNPAKTYYIRVFMPSDQYTSIYSLPFELCLSNPTLSTDELNSKSSISVYPNPAKDFISFKTSEKVKKVEIFDTSARLIRTISGVENNKISLSDIKKGTYVLKIHTQNTVINSKIIKE